MNLKRFLFSNKSVKSVIAATLCTLALGAASAQTSESAQSYFPPCFVLGDSIAQGIGSVSQSCFTVAVQGINSRDYLKIINSSSLDLRASSVVISLGVNDGENLHTFEFLSQLRAQITAAQVTWMISPLKRQNHKAQVTREVAHAYGDETVEIPETILGPDRLHPTGQGYRVLSAMALTSDYPTR